MGERACVAVEWARRDRGLVEGVRLDGAVRGAMCHLPSCRHARAEPVRAIELTCDPLAEVAMCGLCMPKLLPGPSPVLMAAAEPALAGELPGMHESPLLARMGLRHAAATLDAEADKLTAGTADGTHPDSRPMAGHLRHLADRTRELDAGLPRADNDDWHHRVTAAAVAHLAAAWCDGDVAFMPRPLADLLRATGAPEDDPDAAALLRGRAHELLLGRPSPEVRSLVSTLAGRPVPTPTNTALPAEDALDELAQLVKEAETLALIDATPPWDELLAAADGHEADLLRHVPPTGGPGAGLLELAQRPNWLWRAVAHGLVADTELVSGPGWVAARVSGLIRCAVMAAGRASTDELELVAAARASERRAQESPASEHRVGGAPHG